MKTLVVGQIRDVTLPKGTIVASSEESVFNAGTSELRKQLIEVLGMLAECIYAIESRRYMDLKHFSGEVKRLIGELEETK